MERIYLKIDAASISDNTEALAALEQQGLERIQPVQEEISQWRERVAASNRKLAEEGVLSLALVDEMNAHLARYRATHSP
jgi:hypothetical protein